MKTVIIVSKCLRVTKFNLDESVYAFHFKGVFLGGVVRKVMLVGNNTFRIEKGIEYILYVQLLTFTNEVLSGKIIKAKLLDECWDKS